MVVVDLDGTFVRCNTLHLFLRTAFVFHLLKGRPQNSIRIAVQYLKRAFRLTSHLQFKTAALTAAGRDKDLLKKFYLKVQSKINLPLSDTLKSETEPVVMATAAPGFYADLIWPGDLLASEWLSDGTLHELRGEEKLKAVLEHAKTYSNTEIAKVYTDHYDDLPLMKIAGETILVNPSRKTIERVQNAGISFHTF